MDSEWTSEPPGRVISPGGGGDGEAPAAGVVEGSNGSPTVGPVEQPGEPDGNIGPAMFPSEGQTVIPRSQSSPVMVSFIDESYSCILSILLNFYRDILHFHTTLGFSINFRFSHRIFLFSLFLIDMVHLSFRAISEIGKNEQAGKFVFF